MNLQDVVTWTGRSGIAEASSLSARLLSESAGLSLAVGVVSCLVTWAAWKLYTRFWARPLRLFSELRAQGIPGRPFLPIFGNLPEVMKVRRQREADPAYAAATSPFEYFIRNTEQYGPLWTWFFGPVLRLSIADPAVLRQVYVTHNGAFEKSEFLRRVTILGGGLVSSNGATWARQRRLINPAFNHREIKRLCPTILRCAEEAVARWEAAVASRPQDPVFMDAELGKLTLEIIARSAFGMELRSESEARRLDSVLAAFSEYLENIVPAVIQRVNFPPAQYFPTAMNRKLWRSERTVRKYVEEILSQRIAKRRREAPASSPSSGDGESGVGPVAERPMDLLELMLSATEAMGADDNHFPATGAAASAGENDVARPATGGDASQAAAISARGPSGSSMTKRQLMDECMTFLVGGHDTTSNLLTWTMLLLSQHPEWQEKAREEVLAQWSERSAEAGEEWRPTFDSLQELRVVTWVLYEALRLYPPAAVLGRECMEATKISETLTIPAGCDIQVLVAVIHRRKDLWGEDADEFRPERFAGGINKAASHPGAFIPFSLGPRVCIGQNFALVEAKAILGLLLRSFSWRLADGYRHHPYLGLTLKPKHGLPLLLEPRKQGGSGCT